MDEVKTVVPRNKMIPQKMIYLSPIVNDSRMFWRWIIGSRITLCNSNGKIVILWILKTLRSVRSDFDKQHVSWSHGI